MQEVDFRAIRSHNGSLDGGFEELVSQLARLEPRSVGAAFFRKGLGADAGVECFVAEVSGREVGWQAKFLFEWSAGLATQLDGSIETALNKHPRLEEYIVCLPFDLADARRKDEQTALEKWLQWRAKWISKAAPRPLDIRLWSKSDLIERLSRPTGPYAGRLLFWFDKDSLTPEFLVQRFAVSRAALGERYTPENNVDLPIRQTFLGFVRSHQAPRELEDLANEITSSVGHVCRELGGLGLSAAAPTLSKEVGELVDEVVGFNWQAPAAIPTESWRYRIKPLLEVTHRLVDPIYAQKSEGHEAEAKRRQAFHFIYALASALEALVQRQLL